MADDIVTRLRVYAGRGDVFATNMCKDAADEIERLREQVEYLHNNIAMLRNEVADWEFEAHKWQEKAEARRG